MSGSSPNQIPHPVPLLLTGTGNTHLDQPIIIMVSSLAILESKISVVPGNKQGSNNRWKKETLCIKKRLLSSYG